MPLPALLQDRLTLPVIAAPMFLISTCDTVVATCQQGIVGAMPALNARSSAELSAWLDDIHNRLNERAAPYAINLIAHASNGRRLTDDLNVCERHRVPIIITSMSANPDVVSRVHGWGGIVLHDVVNPHHARKAIAQNVDGLILVTGGAGGHAGHINPFALVREIRRFYAGPLVLGGGISDGAGILAARTLGADLVYMGTRFIATQEAPVSQDYKQMIVDASASDILYSSRFSIASANFLKASLKRNGFDPDTGLPADNNTRIFGTVWRDIWSAGQGVGAIDDIPDIPTLVDRLITEYETAYKTVLTGTRLS